MNPLPELHIEYGYTSCSFTSDKFYCARVDIIGVNGIRKKGKTFDCDDSTDRGEGGVAFKIAESVAKGYSDFYGCPCKFIGHFKEDE